ncbi:unnamed protein product [Porites evermanni]|uniref:Uncharacterized protein n=1 Tax=Porites evermanni TaxID=104178 RepID=A0ABN8PSB3_9CNID|nr:unnamed protein product [Porites evermanni]
MKMVNKAKTNDGFVDQKMFKTAGKYGFDCLYLTETSMQVLDGSINHIRPLLRPTCDFVLATRNGGQNVKVGGLMSKLVFDATGKYVHSTRYRQIVETASSRQLSSSAQSTISEYQKHNSVVASVHYQKQRSREVQVKHMNICFDSLALLPRGSTLSLPGVTGSGSSLTLGRGCTERGASISVTIQSERFAQVVFVRQDLEEAGDRKSLLFLQESQGDA